MRLSHGRLLVIFVSDSGLVQNKIIETGEDLSQAELEQMANYLNRTYAGLPLQKVKQALLREMEQEKAAYDRLFRRSMLLFQEAFDTEENRQLFIEGVSYIFDQPEFADLERMKRIFSAFEQKSILVDFLDKCQHSQGVQIFIGSETDYHEIEGCSLITANYANRSGTIGTLGVIGPTRMPYSQVIPIVDYTARLVSQLLDAEDE